VISKQPVFHLLLSANANALLRASWLLSTQETQRFSFEDG